MKKVNMLQIGIFALFIHAVIFNLHLWQVNMVMTEDPSRDSGTLQQEMEVEIPTFTTFTTFSGPLPPGSPGGTSSTGPSLGAKAPSLPAKGGEGGAAAPPPSVSNAQFISAIFSSVPEGAAAAICTKHGNPHEGGWVANSADVAAGLSTDANNYLNCSSFYHGAAGAFKAQKAQFASCHFLLLDDIGTKVPYALIGNFELSWEIETSPGNRQGGIILDTPIVDASVATRLHKAVIDAGLCDPGAGGPLSRWARLPVGINAKPQHVSPDGLPFRSKLVKWNPNARYAPEQIIESFALKLTSPGRSAATISSVKKVGAQDIFIPSVDENPVLTTLKLRGLYKREIEPGKHDITCPWLHEHTDSLDSGTAYFEPDAIYPIGGFCCQHSHREMFHVGELCNELGVTEAQARNKTIIRICPGDMHSVVNAAELVLAKNDRYFQSGGSIVRVKIDPINGDPTICSVSSQALTKILSSEVDFQRWDKQSTDWKSCDPPQRHIGILCDSQSFEHLLPLSGLARQPYFLNSGELVIDAGYNPVSGRYAVFDPQHYWQPDGTRLAAKKALEKLKALLEEFPFETVSDRSAALSAMLTGTVRPSIDLAPGFHVGAPVFGSGKTYLCDLFSAFAGTAGSAKISYPSTSEEATKSISSVLALGPAAVEFDDMDTDWLPHGIIKRMLTSETVSERILGVSKIATSSTRTLVLGSGNNVGPIRDLRRRVVTIHLNPRSATPATKSFVGAPVARVRERRSEYVMAALTIIQAWKCAGSPKADVSSIATYGGDWANYCRHPLIWLGEPDPATNLIDQIHHDPDAEALSALMLAWRTAFGSKPTTVRKVVDAASNGHTELMDALSEFPVIERGEINRSKLGWVLRKCASRIVDGYEFRKAQADGRTAWQVLPVDTTPASPPLPASGGPVGTASTPRPLRHDQTSPGSRDPVESKVEKVVSATGEQEGDHQTSNPDITSPKIDSEIMSRRNV